MLFGKKTVAILTELQIWAGENGLIFTGAHDSRKPISEKALRVMGYATQPRKSVVMDSWRWRASALIGSDLWSRDAVVGGFSGC